ncbi:MAG: FYDLN acid domain-containing protein [Leptospiraceae bacterium]|nr:FYDLN acid domain-containing protein [Leptospiraceae bacterium]MCP5493470.1 FYDLN acid domain-containing protein [Leptospiraceae bacterium]
MTTLEKQENTIKTENSNHKNTLGKKYTCYNCSTKFYDLGKPDKVCPKCGCDQNAKPLTKQKLPKTMFKTSEFDVIEEEEVRNPDEDTIFLDEEDELELDDDQTYPP